MSWAPPGRSALLGLLLAAVLIPSGHLDTVDAGTRFLEARSILERGTTTIHPDLVDAKTLRELTPKPLHPYPDGIYRSPYGIGLPLLWLPFLSAGLVAGRLLGVDPLLVAGAAVSTVNVFVTFGLLFALSRMLAALGAPQGPRRATLVALLVGTNALSFANSCWSEPLAALVTLLGFWLLVAGDGPRWAAAAGACLSYGVLVKPELLLLLLPAGFLLVGRDRRSVAAFLAVAGAGVAAVLVPNLVLRGSFLSFEYSPQAYASVSLLKGALGTVFGEKSLLLFDPALGLAAIGWLARDLPGPLKRLRAPLLLAWGLLFVLYAGKGVWWGGLTFGPRFHYTLVPISLLAIPWALRALMAAIGETRVRLLGWAAAALFLPFQLSGLSVRTNQAQEITEVTKQPQWRAHLTLLRLKLLRGPSAPEVYRKSDFVSLLPGEQDVVIDHTPYRTFQYLDHAPALLLAWRLRRGPGG